MRAILLKEIRSFFTSAIGYLTVGSYLVLNGLFLWVFKGQFNVFDYGFADLGNFFFLAPWVFLLLIPAISMKSFSEEQKLGTLELLLIKPLSVWHLVLGKFGGAFLLCLLALLPTMLYVWTIGELGITTNNFDLGVIYGSYFGLLLLIGMYTSIGLFASVLTNNQIVAFLLGLLFCFLLYFGLDALSTLTSDGSFQSTVQSLGAKAHFSNIGRGILDIKDVVYFVSITLFFLYMTVHRLNHITT